MNHSTKTLMAAAFAGVIGFGLASPAEAEPMDRSTGHESGSEVLPDFCGSGEDVDYAFDLHFSTVVNPHGKDGIPYYLKNVQGTESYTRPSTGGGLLHEFRLTDKDQMITDNGDGTFTILVQSTGQETHSWSHGPQLITAGLFRFEILIDHGGTPTDPSDDAFLDFLGPVAEHGRLDTQDRDFCEDWLAFSGG